MDTNFLQAGKAEKTAQRAVTPYSKVVKQQGKQYIPEDEAKSYGKQWAG